jgi:hypothetical protein
MVAQVVPPEPVESHRGAEDHVGRYRQLAGAGARKAIVSLPDLPAAPAGDPSEPVRRFAHVIDAFRPRE